MNALPLQTGAVPAPRLPFPYQPEAQALAQVQARLGTVDWAAVQARAQPWVDAARHQPAPFWALESLLREYPISSAEGLALMRLAEALPRVPDLATAVALTADQLAHGDWGAAAHSGGGALAELSAQVVALGRKLLPEGDAPGGLLARLGSRAVVAATVRAIQLLGGQFVQGRDMAEAQANAQRQRQNRAGLRWSYDMLGEGARTEADARRYLHAYTQALAALGDAHSDPTQCDGLSIKLSALFPRYEELQHDRVMAELLPRVWTLADAAARADVNLTLDAEESERLELSLDLLEALAQRVAQHHPRWGGLGLAVQAYQTRALAVVDEVVRIAHTQGIRLMVRLVKGAYWDGEIKRAQELGLPDYPVFSRKAHTDLSYLACARAMLARRDCLYPQFASHNAATLAAVLWLAEQAGAQPDTDFELQRLHGMGEAVYRELLRDSRLPCRIYAPVGAYRDLLAYLVRRLLENGANSSFVHQLTDPAVPLAQLLARPQAGSPGLPLPSALYGPGRRAAKGLDLNCRHTRHTLAPALVCQVPQVADADPAEVDSAMQTLHQAATAWERQPLAERAACLRRAADALEARLPEFVGLLAHEAGKTPADGVAEVREAVDFCRYYAQQAEHQLAEHTLPGPTGEHNLLRWRGRGVFVCISPWNFPLAIFTGQVVAALVAGNAVAAKPAEQTPGVAQRMVALLHQAGVPTAALRLLPGPGDTVGAALVAHPLTAGVCFTGSTAVARQIHRSLAAQDGPIVPLIAETGGINAMVVDSTALPEQVVDAVIKSAFRSAGQRCSALRLLCVHHTIADTVLTMLTGAMAELRLGAPWDLATDVGPVIDAAAQASLRAEIARLHTQAQHLASTPLPTPAPAGVVAPVAFELHTLSALRQEIFGPVLHVLRWQGEVDALLADINRLGYGLTLGLHSRIDSRTQRLATLARVGNVYINRDIIGAVVGVQPFGGQGLSGTGPKAGGPHYLYRFCTEQTVTVNTTAAGGNAALLAGAGMG